MIRIVNETGLGHHTRILGEDGQDLGRLLEVEKIEFGEVLPNELISVRLTCWAKVDLRVLPEGVTLVEREKS